MARIKLRRARLGETDILTQLSLRSKRSNGYDDDFMAACVEELTVTRADITENEFWVAEADRVCGCACLHVDAGGTSGEVGTFFIDPDYQRRGIGRLLAGKLLERARALGMHTLRLDADPAAVPFYEAMGFVVVGTAPSGSIPGRSLPHMTLALTTSES